MPNKAVPSFLLAGAFALGLCALAIASADANGGFAPPSDMATRGAPLSPAERGELTRQLVLKWGPYVQHTYAMPAAAWAKRMVPSLVHADPGNFRAALTRDTFEGAMSELAGTGRRLDDEAIISQLAFPGENGTQSLGSLDNDLVYTPISPCRVVDTRTSSGVIPANGTRDFAVINSDSYNAQGGTSGDCGTNGVRASAVALNVTAVLPSANGFATAYALQTARPSTSSINYAAGAIVNNTLVVKIPNPFVAQRDITVFSFASSHFVVDVVGYFAPPVATALECLDTADATANIAAGFTGIAVAPACAVGYTQTTVNCNTQGSAMALLSSGKTCTAKNNDTVARDLRASRTCCRVPGR